MRKYLFLIIFVTGYYNSWAQHVDIKRFINAWKVSDSSQSHRAHIFYDELLSNMDTVAYQQTVESLYDYLQNHPDPRLEIRTIMYQAFGAVEFRFPMEPYILSVKKAMKMVNDLDDDQLKAELYGLRGELRDGLVSQMTSYNISLYYKLKAIDLQRKVGFSHFNLVPNRFLNVSTALYYTKDYRQSINYGLEFFDRLDSAMNWNKKFIINQYDILGACYKKLGIYDSTLYYYVKIIDTLRDDTSFIINKNLWAGIAKGNIGLVLAMRHHYEPALLLLHQYLKVSIEEKDRLNIVLAQNYLSRAYFWQKKYAEALSAAWQANEVAAKNHLMEQRVPALQMIADIYYSIGKPDSALLFYTQFHQYSDSLNDILARSRYSAMQEKINFDDMQYDLAKTSFAYIKVRNTRNAILGGIALLTIIAILLYNRYRLQEKNKLQEEEHKRLQAEKEVQQAQQQIHAFTNSIIEKNKLIKTLEQKILESVSVDKSSPIAEDLTQYTLLTNEEWENFRKEFTKAYPDFLQGLNQKVVHVTPAEERLAALIFLQLKGYQIASALGISKESVARSKRRLKQRLQLNENILLEDYIRNEISPIKNRI